MTESGEQITFEQLLDRHGWIQVPMIQRDYAQGRESEAEVRKEFLDALHGALSLPTDDPAVPLNLDFIYGSVEGHGDTRFLPLDGQQRLTTLFLLHWYLAWRDGCWEKFMESICPSGNSRFRYAVRPSSTEFFDCLVKFQPEGSPDSHRSPSPMLKNQPWYFRHWRLDPTIQSSLEMLDAIHERFSMSSGLYERITDSDRPAITFQLMDLENFGLSDDLYIKMNARGKPLTAFETFKARYEQELESQFKGEALLIDDNSFSVAEFFSRRMDTKWADFFWQYRNRETNLFDEPVMNLFRTIALLSRDPESNSYIRDVSLLRRFVTSTYSTFYSHGWLDRSFSELLILLLELWTKGETGFTPQLPDTRFFDEASLFEKAMNEPTELTFTEIVQFYGYVVYVRQNSESLDPDAFQEWMRVVFNLSVNTTYDRPADMQRSISALLKLAPNSVNILQFLAASDTPTAGFSPQQVSEEKFKAELILADVGWRRLIDQAEGHGYFKGQIEFLLDFCGVLEKRDGQGGVNWKDSEHSLLQEQFEKYLRKVGLMFTDRGLTHQGQYRWERALLSIGDYFLPSGRQNVSFLANPSTEQASWKRLLRGGTGSKALEARGLLRNLLDRLITNDSLGTQLDKIIDEVQGLEPWRQAFIETPKAFEYCEKRAVRRNSEKKIYLLKKTQLNGAHAELFTYCLFHNKLLPIASSGDGFHPLELREYVSVNGTDTEPGILFMWWGEKRSCFFNVKWNGRLFIITVPISSFEEMPDIYDALCNGAGFAAAETHLVRKTSDVLYTLLEVRKALSATVN